MAGLDAEERERGGEEKGKKGYMDSRHVQRRIHKMRRETTIRRRVHGGKGRISERYRVCDDFLE
jgi:hypothetical protein